MPVCIVYHKEKAMTLMSFPVLVAFAPPIAGALVGLVIELVPVMRMKWDEWKNSSPEIEWLKDLAWTVAMLGSAVAGYLGVSQESPATTGVAVAWFALFASIARALTARLGVLAEMAELRERAKQHRKLAGTVRSIVRSELAKSLGTQKDDLGS